MLSMAEVVLQSLREAADLTCSSCRRNEHLNTVLARAVASAEQLINHLEHGSY